MSEEVALAAADLAMVEQLRARILEWEDCYDRLAGAFDLHLAIGECQAALSDYAGVFYDVVLGELVERAERADTARKAWTEIGARAQADAAARERESQARMAAIVEACEAVAAFAESYGPQSYLAKMQPSFYGVFRVYGKNARAAVSAVRPQADALLAKMAELITANNEVAHVNASYLTALSAAYGALESYAHGNGAPGLAEEVAAHILATIEKAGAE